MRDFEKISYIGLPPIITTKKIKDYERRFCNPNMEAGRF